MSQPEHIRTAILHGAGYVGRELIRLVSVHPLLDLSVVTSRSHAGEPINVAHPELRGVVDLAFSSELDDVNAVDAVFIAAEHGKGIEAVVRLLDAGYEGKIVDLSADFRLRDPAGYPKWYDFEHPEPELLAQFAYGIPELYAPYETDRFVANPGCFATAISMALAPLRSADSPLRAYVTAMTGASGSGATPKVGTHYPTRDGNARAYNVLHHRHQGEIDQVVGEVVSVDFVPSSGPWTRGIWGTAHIASVDEINASDLDAATVGQWFDELYGGCPFVRVWPGQIPEMRWSVNSPFVDLGFVQKNGRLVIGFAIDNLMKGAASQAIQNLNLLFGLPETEGLFIARSEIALRNG